MPNVTFKSNFDDGIKTLYNLQSELPDSADDAANRIAHEWMKAGKREIKSTPRNEVTGTGLDSFNTNKIKDGSYGVYAASYLNVLDKGRNSGSRPDITNPRFIAAARQYGMNKQVLADVIQEQGTEAYPWIEPATKRIRRNAPKRVKIEINRAVKESQTTL